jgi:hypothetical protein
VPSPPSPPAPVAADDDDDQFQCNGLSREEAFLSILSTVTPAVALLAPSTPQGAAFEWIVASDVARLDPCDSARAAIQRYVLATLYYSTVGTDWTNATMWLSESSECAWAGVECAAVQTTANSTEADDDDNDDILEAVVSIDLGECVRGYGRRTCAVLHLLDGTGAGSCEKSFLADHPLFSPTLLQ